MMHNKHNRGKDMILAGVDLAWQSEKNPSAISFGVQTNDTLTVTKIEPAVYGITEVFDKLNGVSGLKGISIDAPLIIKNTEGQRSCETGVGKTYGSRYASCHTSNTKLYPNAKSVYLSDQLQESGFGHLCGERWQIECYPHPAIIEIFGLSERLKYKKGTVAEKRMGQKILAALLSELNESRVLRLEILDQNQQVFDESHIDALRGRALKSNEDALDSVLCLYIAGLYAKNFDGQVFGDTDSGYIWVPRGVC
jgi:predicted RNase H-like nuclease